MKETTVTEKDATTIPTAIRRALGIAPGTILEWSTQGQFIQARKKPGSLNDFQKHIRQRAGSWNGNISGKELLWRTRTRCS